MNLCHLVHPELPPLRERPAAHHGLPKIQQLMTIAIQRILAADPVTGHVLVHQIDGELEWIPYIYLRWGCPSLGAKSKEWLDNSIQGLSGAPIIHRWMLRLPRRPITNYHRIIPLFYMPPLDDGTPHGCYARIVYRLWGKNRVGVSPLELLQGSVPEITAFVAEKQREIRKAMGDQARLKRVLGLNVVRHDAMPGHSSRIRAKTPRFFLIGESPSRA